MSKSFTSPTRGYQNVFRNIFPDKAQVMKGILGYSGDIKPFRFGIPAKGGKAVNQSFYNNFHNVLRLFDVLTNFPFITSETLHDYYL